MRDVAIEARDDHATAGQVVVRLRAGERVDANSRFRLKLVDAAASEARLPDTEHTPVSSRNIGDDVEIVVGVALAAHPLLSPGTAVLMEIGGVRGEFLWPAVSQAQPQKRKRIALRIVPPAPVIVPPSPADHVATAMNDFAQQTLHAPETGSEAAQDASSATLHNGPASDPAHRAEDIVSSVEVAPAPPLPAFHKISEIDAKDEIPDIFRADAWPRPPAVDAVTSSPAGAPMLSGTLAMTAKPFEATVEDAKRPASTADFRVHAAANDSTPAAAPVAETSAAPRKLDSEKRPPRLPPKPAVAAGPSRFARGREILSAAGSRFDRFPPAAAAGFGFAVIATVAAAAWLWPYSSKRAADARGVPFQDQRRWQDGQLKKPAPIDLSTGTAAATKQPPTMTPTPTPAAVPPVTLPAPTPVAAAPTAQATPKAPVATASAAPAVCLTPEPKVTPLPAGLMNLGFRSVCHRQQLVTIDYGGLDMKRRFDVDGGLDITVDCIFGAATPVNVRFADGKSIAVPAACHDLDRLSKIAVVWRQPIDLDLHVFERPAPAGSAGALSSARPGVRDLARDLAHSERSARGFLSSTATAKSLDGGMGVRMLVYTAFHAPQSTTQTIPFAIDFATRGETMSADTCIGGRYAAPTYEVVRLSARGQVTREDGQFAALTCGATVPNTLRFNQTLHAPLRIRN